MRDFHFPASSKQGPSHGTTTAADASPTDPISPTDGPNVLSRLHALFNTSHPFSHDGPPVEGLERSVTEPVLTAEEVVSPGAFIDREAIKVLVVTWNMGDALPKGDLSVLLGDVPKWTPPSDPPGAGLPPLPIENKHPYHIVVVAGQECPTHSGVPRGLGGGLMKGVHVRANHRKEKEQRKEVKEKDKEGKDKPDDEDMPDSEKDKEAGLKSPMLGETDEDEDRSTGLASPAPNTPVLHKHNHAPGSKGWSTMLDDWFCGNTKVTDQAIVPSLTPSPDEMTHTHPMPSPVPFPSTPGLQPPNLIRSTSMPGTSSPTEPIHVPVPTRLLPPSSLLNQSPLARSASSSASESSASTPELELPQLNLPSPGSSPKLRPKSASTATKPKDRPAIIIPNDEPERTKDGGGCYLHLVKERLMGMYLSVYVYKGCENLIQGVDKDFVPAGLVGGRFGNKGGIGISMKLGDRSFLFVNSHLAAHTTRVSARLANIAKIKSELRLDCFLPKDDPRAAAEDLTDRFDSVFWCGDLNFRLDLSRLHAEWLVEQKKYDEALMWDQLRAAMRDPKDNPFPGFQEHTIDFPPTFKYDVWRSVKATNRELRRTLKRRGTVDSKTGRRPSQADNSSNPAAQSNLSHVPEAGSNEELATFEEENRGSDDDVRTLASRRSFESTAGGYTSAGPSTAGTDIDEREDFATSVDASAYGSRHKALEVAFKEKTKKFLGLVKMDRVLSPSPSSKRKLGRNVSKRIKEKPSMDFDTASRRTSVSSLASLEQREVPPPRTSTEGGARVSMSSSRSGPVDVPLGPPRRPSDTSSWISSSPNQPLSRKFSVLKRSVSGRSVKDDGSNGRESFDDDIDEGADTREGVYDTSKKQRVPSWCDRVLWKSLIEPDQLETLPGEDIVVEKHGGAFNRLSHAFANFGGHLKLSMTRTSSQDPHPADRINNLRALPPTPPDSASFTASPEVSPSLRPTLVENGSVPMPKRPSPKPSPHQSRLLLGSRARSGSTHHPLLDAAPKASPPAFPKITFDPALPADADKSHLPPTPSRPRANSDGAPSAVTPKRTFSSDAITSSPVKREEQHRRSSGGSLRSRTRTRTLESPTLAQRPPEIRHLSTGMINPPGHPMGVGEDRNSFVKFFKDIPNWLHHKNSSHLELPSRPVYPPLDRPRRHDRGEVECLHYGTIDDAAMRQLEGRSDHRPAIFSAAVYI